MTGPHWGFVWYGEVGDVSEFRAVTPGRYARYTVTGHARILADPRAVELLDVTVTDEESGAILTTDYRPPPTFILPVKMRPDDVARFRRDAQYAIGLVRAQLGRPEGTGAIVNDEQILSVIRQMRKDGRKVTRGTVAATSSSFTESNLRYYLTKTGRTFRDISRLS